MTSRILVVGGVAGGATTAAQLRRLDEECEIVMFEKDEHISFGNCGMPYFIGDIIKERDHLFAADPKSMKEQLNIDVRVFNEVLSIDRNEKSIKVKDLRSKEEYHENYDFLVLAPGAAPFLPPINGLKESRHFVLRNIEDMDRIKEFLETRHPASCSIIGGGFIGIEMAENLSVLGMDVNLIEASPHLMGVLDEDMSEMIEKEVREHGVNVFLNDGVQKVDDKGVIITQRANEIHSDFIIVATGVRPQTRLAGEAGLSIGKTGGIKVNEYMQTSDSSIYAVGDAVESKSAISGKPVRIPLAWPAHRQSYIAAKHLTGDPIRFKGLLGTSVVKIFSLTAASTGLNEKQLLEENIAFHTVAHTGKSHAGYYPGAERVSIKMHFSEESGRILGAQIIGGEGVDKRIDILSACINGNVTADRLQEIETAYSPPYSSPKDLINIIGYKAESMIKNKHQD
ncbi:CoA-disulfide reductase [Rossellomorea vietnamensis]|uniref:CoA-disulfide reductase n=1 Tax=Rossellomorea vietnamensis TaxID=218284 RepID=A0A5D4NQB4_9BACI|nr:CoA-disulfide reductase [Rossellomorea vietnamensis]TYS15854.1 CoA-disulfide reductase [Rossellomorea vietnamensis]